MRLGLSSRFGSVISRSSSVVVKSNKSSASSFERLPTCGRPGADRLCGLGRRRDACASLVHGGINSPAEGSGATICIRYRILNARLAAGPEPVAEPEEVFLVDGIQHSSGRLSGRFCPQGLRPRAGAVARPV